ncbi:ABC-2 family transporter protein [Levilactobacillus suantsaii]|uniref:ABC transporter permease n=1 Tax=Levilactobacillus suantsaii TaxID=2292255 RepID=UPI0015F6F863|nr:ABC-2 family transporter protein [Levilactobacillus suantsaii]QMU08247.1 ABC-2 family transporter protein [Levilactobacillus suantsaii]
MIKLYRILLSQSLGESLVYRGTSILTAIFGIMFYLIALVTGTVYFSFSKSIFGWDFLNYLNLITTANLISYLYQFLFVSGHEHLTEQILDGTLDYSLVRPVNSYYFHMIFRADFPSLIPVFVSGVIEALLLVKLGTSILSLISYILAILAGVIFVFAINQIIVTISFWIDGLSALAGVPEYIMDASAYPASIYPRIIQNIFLWIFPSLTVTNLPANIIRGKYSTFSLIWLFFIDVLLIYISILEWRQGLRHYASAD